MTAVLPAHEPTAGEREQPPLVAELHRIRGLLEAYAHAEPASHEEPQALPFEPALDRLARLIGLSSFERDLLLLAAAVELDGEIAALVALLLDGDDPRPTFGLALAVLPDAHWDALSPSSPLRRWRLLEPGAGPTLASRPLRIDERILHALTGIDALDDRLEGVVRIAAATALSPSQLRVADELAHTLSAADSRAVVRIDGDDRDAQTGVGVALAHGLGRRALLVRATALPPPGPELAGAARLIDREALLLDALPLVDAAEAGAALVAAFLEELDSPQAVVIGGEHAYVAGRVRLQRSARLPDPAEGRSLWIAALGDPLSRALADAVEDVAQHFRLGAAAIADVATELAAIATADGPAPDPLRRLCRERARVSLEGLAERIDPAAGWDDLVLPAGHLDLLRQIVSHVRRRTQVYERWGFGDRTSRGLGVTALFSGDSGTGKTLAAEVLAGELGLDLYRIDLAATVSKYIGETEKNLRRLFDAAEASGAVLLFDEADALFGKRGEVKDGHDRYANLEVAYLLQRMEAYRGLAILTTNLRSNVDRAFLRRLRFVVQFPFPDAAQRAELWRRMFPPATPLDGIEPDALARLTASGGSIQAIALAAAFSAAEEGSPVTRRHVLRAAQVEYAKAERSLTETESEALR